jgi:hypothetical protein
MSHLTNRELGIFCDSVPGKRRGRTCGVLVRQMSGYDLSGTRLADRLD